MKKILFILILLTATAFSQVRFLSYSGTTGTSVDTLTFDFYVWEVSVINDGAVSDTLWFWTEGSPTANRKIVLLGGEFINLRFNSSINRIYLQGSTSGIKRRVIAKP